MFRYTAFVDLQLRPLPHGRFLHHPGTAAAPNKSHQLRTQLLNSSHSHQPHPCYDLIPHDYKT